MSWADCTKKKKIVILKCCLLLFYTATTSHFSNRLWHGTKSGLFTVTSNDQLSGWTEKRLQSQTCTQKKRSWSLFGGLLLVWSTIALVKPLHLRSMLNKLMRCTKNCNTFSQHCPAKGSSSPPWLLPIACHTTNIQQLSKLGYKVLLPPPYSTELLRTDYTSSSILTTFYRENTFTVSRRQKMLSKGSSRSQSIKKKRSQSMDFTLQDGTNLFLIGKNVLIEMVPILN